MVLKGKILTKICWPKPQPWSEPIGESHKSWWKSYFNLRKSANLDTTTTTYNPCICFLNIGLGQNVWAAPFLFPYRPEIPQEMVGDSPHTKRWPKIPLLHREMPRCSFRQAIPPLPLLCSHVLHKRTFIPHFHSTHIAWRNKNFHSAEECNMMSPSLRFKSVGLERFFVMPFILSHGTRMLLGQYKTRTDESFPI